MRFVASISRFIATQAVCAFAETLAVHSVRSRPVCAHRGEMNMEIVGIVMLGSVALYLLEQFEDM
jgi:hypothetical protein